MDLVHQALNESCVSVRKAVVSLRSQSHARIMVMLCVLLVGCSDGVIESPPDATRPAGPLANPGHTPSEAKNLLGLFPSRKPLVLADESSCFAFEAFRDGSHIVCANGPSVDMWDMVSGKKVTSLKHPYMVTAVALAPDEQTLLTTTIGATSPVRLWDLKDGRQIREYASPFAPVETVPSETVPSETAAQIGGDRVLSRVPRDAPSAWNTPRGSFGSTIGFGYTSVAFSPSGQTIAIGCEDGATILVEKETGERTRRLVGHAQRILKIVFSPDGTRILSQNRFGTIQLWDHKSETLIREYGTKQTGRVPESRTPMAFSPDGSEFAFHRGAIHIVSAVTGEEIRQLPNGGDRIHSPWSFDGCVAFLPADGLLQHFGCLLNLQDAVTGEIGHSHHCRAGMGRFFQPRVEYVRYLPDIAAAMAVEIANDENTMHQDWVTISLVPFSEFWNTSKPLESTEDGFTVKFPEEPARHECTNTMNSIPVTEVIYSCWSVGGHFEMFVTTYPTPFMPSQTTENLDAARDRVSQIERFELTKDEQVQIGNHTGRAVWSKQVGVTDGTVKHYLFAYRGNREYRASVITRRGKFPTEAAAAFLSSFALID